MAPKLKLREGKTPPRNVVTTDFNGMGRSAIMVAVFGRIPLLLK